MQKRPDPSQLMDAVAKFLATELQPSVPDARLGFRNLIAANLCRLVAAELRAAPERAAAELAALRALLPDAPPEGDAELLSRELARRLRGDGGEGDDRAWRAQVRRHLLAALAADLAVTNPRFDLRLELE